jgi:hypothetical protein
MTKPNLSLKGTKGYIVFSDDVTYEDLNDQACIVLVEGDFDAGNDKAVRHLIEGYDQARNLDSMDPMIPVKVSTENDGVGKVRIITIDFLLKYYLQSRKNGGKIGVSVG